MKAGLWIDHKKAVVVKVAGKKASAKTVKSNMEKHVRLAGGSRGVLPYLAHDARSDRKKDDRYEHHLKHYYDRVITMVRSAEEFYIMGPGQAKVELRKEMEKEKELAAKPITLTTVDKMTGPQITAKVKEFFSPKH
jgi:hypothetical protein